MKEIEHVGNFVQIWDSWSQ